MSFANNFQTQAQEYSGCFIIDNNGEYNDISEICLTEEQVILNNKIGIFDLKLRRMGVKVKSINCVDKENTIRYGSYNSGTNTMTICQNNNKDYKQKLETIVHESWHAVQDCADGLDNSDDIPITLGDYEAFKTLLNSLSPEEIENIKNYESGQRYEIEAFALEKYPNLVLKGLDICAK